LYKNAQFSNIGALGAVCEIATKVQDVLPAKFVYRVDHEFILDVL
jgi:hypothetical protein